MIYGETVHTTTVGPDIFRAETIDRYGRNATGKRSGPSPLTGPNTRDAYGRRIRVSSPRVRFLVDSPAEAGDGGTRRRVVFVFFFLSADSDVGDGIFFSAVYIRHSVRPRGSCNRVAKTPARLDIGVREFTNFNAGRLPPISLKRPRNWYKNEHIRLFG